MKREGAHQGGAEAGAPVDQAAEVSQVAGAPAPGLAAQRVEGQEDPPLAAAVEP